MTASESESAGLCSQSEAGASREIPRAKFSLGIRWQFGNPPNCTKPWWLGNQNGFIQFPWFTCHDTGASRAAILGGGNLEVAAVFKSRKPHRTRVRARGD